MSAGDNDPENKEDEEESEEEPFQDECLIHEEEEGLSEDEDWNPFNARPEVWWRIFTEAEMERREKEALTEARVQEHREKEVLSWSKRKRKEIREREEKRLYNRVVSIFARIRRFILDSIQILFLMVYPFFPLFFFWLVWNFGDRC